MTTETDRELLEWAAKAAGWVSWDWLAGDGVMNVYDAYGRHDRFDPLTDDGDALRLAIELDLSIDPRGHAICVISKDGEHVILESSKDSEIMPITRRAIVRAAAAIGKAMK